MTTALFLNISSCILKAEEGLTMKTGKRRNFQQMESHGKRQKMVSPETYK